VNADKAQALAPRGATPTAKAVWLSPSLCRSLLALLKKAPSAYGWCRTRWSRATLALHLQGQRGIEGSSATMRRWLHRLGGVGKRAQVVARDDAPERIEKLARIRHTLEPLEKRAVLRFADELDIHLLPKGGYQWMPQGETVKLLTPGQNQTPYLAGALDLNTGRIGHCPGFRKTNALFRALLDRLERRSTKARVDKIYVVVDNSGIPKAKAVERWLATHPRFRLLFLPTSCPQANPLERAFGDVHAKCTWNHQRHRLAELVGDVEQHLSTTGPWHYQLSPLSSTPEVTTAVDRIVQEQQFPQVA
jgi:hypothetical protein